MTPLRRKMIRQLELDRMSPRTIESYLWGVKNLALYYHRSPDEICVEEVCNFMHYILTERKLATSSCNLMLAGIRYFYCRVLERTDFDPKMYFKRSGRLPEPLSQAEVSRLLEAATYPKHRVLLMTAYSAGLRVSELVRLQPQDIHSERMLIRVKAKVPRTAILCCLRGYWKNFVNIG